MATGWTDIPSVVVRYDPEMANPMTMDAISAVMGPDPEGDPVTDDPEDDDPVLDPDAEPEEGAEDGGEG